MCAGDLAVMTYDWVEDRETPFPDFNSHHQCRNFERILEWTKANTVQMSWSQVTRFEDTVDLPASAIDVKGVISMYKNQTTMLL